MTTEEITTLDDTARAAHVNREKIIVLKQDIGIRFLMLAHLLKTNRDLSLYKFLDYDTFEEFLGDPDVSMKRSKAYGLIRQYELFVEKLGYSEEVLAGIGTSKLRVIIPVVESDPEEWIGKAKALSKSDLITEVRAAQGRDVNIPGQETATLKREDTLPARLFTPQAWKEMVKGERCCVCGARDVNPAHFPRTRGAGTEEWKAIPLCGVCHREQHDGASEWLWKWRVKLFDWFYGKLVGGATA